ncbi:MAG: LemA family protein [Clostridia bacterium]|nr:LemA family protein [Clostridia bacterium]
MANALDEMNDPIVEGGRDVNVIAKRLPVEKPTSAVILEIVLWCLLIIPGVIYLICKIKAKNYFKQLEQKLQHDASQIDNYLEQRVMILQNCAKLLDKAIELDKSTFENIAKYRSGTLDDETRNALSGSIDGVSRSINLAFENYPDLKAHNEIADAMQQNSYLQREITAAREVYNDTVNTWNREIFMWPVKQQVAAKCGYTTRIPFATTKEIKEQARGVFF